MPEDKAFIDTNIIIYAYDVTAGKKHETASIILTDLWDSGLGVISTQVLQDLSLEISQARLSECLDDLLDEVVDFYIAADHHSPAS